MKCSKCGNELLEHQKVCPNCGTPVHTPKFCPDCGNERNPNDKFCDQCGHRFLKEAAPAPRPTEVPMAAPVEQHPSAAKEIQREGSRKTVTILFVDMKGSTEIIRNMDPEEAREVLFPTMEKLISIVYEYGGIVIATGGDGLVAIFGAPKAFENHGMRACLAALSMQKQSKYPLRIGLNSGEILLEYDGSKYEAVGAPVHLAARMEEMAKPGSIQLTQNTLNFVGDIASYESLGKVVAKGFSEPIEIYDLKSINISKTFNELEVQFHKCQPFVNREQETAQLKGLLKDAKEGRGNIVGLSADSGFGKSRVVFELTQSDLAKDCNILLSGAFITPIEIPLLLIKNLFNGLFGITKFDTLEGIQKKIQPFLSGVDTPNAMTAALSLLQIDSTDPEWTAVEPALKRKYIFEVGTKILLNYSLAKPLIIIFEDVHWIDKESELFLDSFFSQISKLKILVIITFRPVFHDHWVSKSNYSRIVLSPLGNNFDSKLLDNLIGNDPSLNEIKGKLLGVVEGNPFFLQELVLSLVAEKILIGEPQKYHLREGTNVNELHLPATILSIYQTKIDTLDSFEKKVLQVASVIGNKFVYSKLIQLLDFSDEREVRAALNKLTENQFLYEDQLYPEPGYVFVHALTYDTVYHSMLKKTRKALHLKLFQILESSGGEEQTDKLQILADHAFLGEDWEKAFYYCIKAAQKVYEINAFTSCASLSERALIAAEHLPINDLLSQKIMRVHYNLYYVYVPLGRFNEQYDHLQKALKISLDRKDGLFESLIHSALCIHYMGYKDINEALVHAEKAYAIAKELHSIDAIAIAQFALVHVNLFLGRFKELSEINQKLEETIGGNLDFRTEYLKLPIGHLARCYDSWGRAFTGDFPPVIARKEKWFAECKNINEPNIANVCRFAGMGFSYYLQGDYEQSIEYSLTGLRYSIAVEAIIFIPMFYSILAIMNIRIGKIEEGKDHLAKAIAIAEKIHASYVSATSIATISDCLLLLGEYKRAEEFCTKAINQVKERNLYSIYSLLIRTSGEIDLYLPNPNFEEIKKKLMEALELTTKYNALPYVARCHLSLSLMYKKMGDVEKEKSELKMAIDLFEKLGMPYWIKLTKETPL